jgi:hypothetical protein
MAAEVLRLCFLYVLHGQEAEQGWQPQWFPTEFKVFFLPALSGQ